MLSGVLMKNFTRRFCAMSCASRWLVLGFAVSAMAAQAQWVARGWAGPEPTTQSSNVHATDGVPRAEYAQIDTIMRQFMQRTYTPNAQLAVAYEGKLIYSRAYRNTYDAATNPNGRQLQVNLGTDTVNTPQTPCTPPDCFNEPAYVDTYVDTRFRVASLSKHLTGLAIAQLVLDGLLQPDLSDVAYTILRNDTRFSPDPNPYAAAPADNRMLNVTVRQLVQHEWGLDRDCIIFPSPLNCQPAGQPQHLIDYRDSTSGYVIPWPYPYNNNPATTTWKRSCRDVLAIDLPVRLLHYTPGEPPASGGSYYQYYNNVGFCWLSQIIEIKTGMTYEAYVRAKVMNPAGVDWARIGLPDTRDRIDYSGLTADEVNFYYDTPRSVDRFAALRNAWCAIYTRAPFSPCVVPRSMERLPAETSGAGAWVISAQEYLRVALSSNQRTRAPHLLDFPGTNATGSDLILTGATLPGNAANYANKPPAATYGYHLGIYSALVNTAPAGWQVDHAGSFPATRAIYTSNRRGWSFVVTMNTNPEWSLGGNSNNCSVSTVDRRKAWCELLGNNTLPANNVGPAVTPTTATSLFYQLLAMYNDTTMRARMQTAPDLWANQIALGCRTDVDGSGARRATSDGVMLLRAMLGLRGTAITSGSGLSTATQTHDRTDRTARDFVSTRMLDIDGDGVVSADRDGVILLRAMLGFTGANVTNGVNQSGATRTTWDTGATNQQIKTYLNTNCAAAL